MKSDDCSKMEPQQGTEPIVNVKKSANDFIFGKLIGEGSFSTVFLAQEIHYKREYAIKVCEKLHIVKENKSKAIFRERHIMNLLTEHPSPYFIKLFCTFQDSSRLFFVMSYAKNGELAKYLQKAGSFSHEVVAFYSAEIIQALDHLHNAGVIHRDLKPQNILLNEEMHIQITDFGSAKVLNDPEEKKSERKNSFVGTALYVSPEMLTNKMASTSSDLWSLGCIIFQLLSGAVPFHAPNDYLIFQKILKLEYKCPDHFSESSKDLVQSLMVLDPLDRLGSSEVEQHYPSLKAHSFYRGLNWDNLHLQTAPKMSPTLPDDALDQNNEPMMLDGLKPGFDERHLNRLLDLSLHDGPLANRELEEKLAAQERDNIWHAAVENNLILKQGLVDRKKGYFSRRRMLILTTGPHLFCCDPSNISIKRLIPWSKELRAEAKSVKSFYIHTPKKSYFLEDAEGKAHDWVEKIEELHKKNFSS